MRLRAQPPVYSPLSLPALLGGARAASGGATAARARVTSALEAEYAPRGLLLTDSGTSALALALQLAARERPGPAALPAFCCYDIATAADAAGVPFLLYDVDPLTLAPDHASLERALGAGAGSVVVVHLYGVPVDLDALAASVSAAAPLLIEDAAQAVGARIGRRPAGAGGRYGVLSFGRGKGVTGGRGGALLANDAAAAAAVAEIEPRLAAEPGAGAVPLLAQWLLGRPSVYGVPASLPFLRLGETVYHPPRPPARVSAFALGVLAETIALAPAEAVVRRTHARRLLDAMGPGGAIRGYAPPPGAEPGYLRLPALVADGALPATRTAEARRLGIWPSYPRSLADLPGFGERRLNPAEPLAGSRELARRAVTLPTHSRLASRDLAALERWMARLPAQRG